MSVKIGIVVLLLTAAGAAPALADRAFGTSNQLPPVGNKQFYGHP